MERTHFTMKIKRPILKLFQKGLVSGPELQYHRQAPQAGLFTEEQGSLACLAGDGLHPGAAAPRGPLRVCQPNWLLLPDTLRTLSQVLLTGLCPLLITALNPQH